MTRSNGNLALVLSGDNLCEGTDHVFLFKRGNNVTLKIFRHEIAAIGIGALGQHIVNENLAAKMTVKILFVFVGSSSGLGHLSTGRSRSERLIDGLVQFRFDCLTALHTLDFIGKTVEVALHIGVGVIVLSGENTHAVSVGVEETFHRIPQLCSFVSEFSNCHNQILLY